MNPDPLRNDISDHLFSHPESIPTETLERCLTLKADVTRRNAATLLLTRGTIDEETAARLITDSDPNIRLIAAQSLARLGIALDEATIKKALISVNKNALSVLAHNTDDSFYVQYQRSQLAQMGHDELQKKFYHCSIFDYLEAEVLYRRFTKRYVKEICENLTDGFKKYFEGKLDKLADVFGGDQEQVNKVRKLENYIRKELTTATLDALCNYGKKIDLDLVRKTLDKHDIDYSDAILRYLARFGDWSDKDNILAFENLYTKPRGLLSSRLIHRDKRIAKSLYAIGKSRLIDLLNLDINIAIKRTLITILSQKDIRSFTDNITLDQLNNEDSQYRKIWALKCVQAINKTRNRTLLDKYVNKDGHRYYNSIHWLDLGASMSRQVVKAVTKFELGKLE